MKRVAWYTAIVLLTLMVLILLWQFRQVIVLFLLSLAMAAAFRPFIEFFIQRGVSRGIALLLAYLIVVAVIGGLIFITSSSLIHDIEVATNNFTAYYERIKVTWPASGTLAQRSLVERLPPPDQLFDTLAGEQGASMAQALFGVTANVFTFLANIAIILIISMYWSADAIRFERLFLSLIPIDQRTRMRHIWRSIEQGVGAYIRSELIQSILAGFLLWLGFRLIGLPYPTLLAVFGALAWLIPWFGGVIAFIPPLLFGLGISIPSGIAAAVYTLIVLLIMETVIEPRFFPRQRFSSIILVLVLLILADAFGLIGLILAPLLAAAIQITVKHLFQPQVQAAPAKPGDSQAAQELLILKERLLEAQRELDGSQEPPSPEMLSFIDRLNRLIDETNDYLIVEPNMNR